MYAYREEIEEKGQTREETRTTKRKRKINLAYLAKHRTSLLLFLSADLILTF